MMVFSSLNETCLIVPEVLPLLKVYPPSRFHIFCTGQESTGVAGQLVNSALTEQW